MIHTNGNFEKKAQNPPQGLLKGLLNWIVRKITSHPKISLSAIAVPAGVLYGSYHFGKGRAQGQAKTEFDPRTILIGTLLGLGGGGLYHMITEDEEDEEENEKSLQKALIAGALLGTGAGALLSGLYEGI